jgi:DNA repair protein SbcC/Rad50
MKKVSDLIKLHKNLNKAWLDLERQNEFPEIFYGALLSGENEVYQKNISESKTFHEDWIETIESFFPSLNKITKDPKSGLKYLQQVEAIEKAKKVNSDSIRHLAANTHMIKEVKEGNVVPSKILTTQAEINYAIYENRFIKTLVDRLFTFVNHRYELVKNNIESFQNNFFNFKSNFEMRESEIDLEIKLKVKQDLADESVDLRNKELLDRISYLLKQINGVRTSPFMEEIKNAKPVTPPIMQTSILLKNVDYKNCYMLWLYLDKYNVLNFDVEVSEQNLTLDQLYLRNVYQTALTMITNVYGNQKALEDHYQYLDVKEYKRKAPKYIRKTLDELLTTVDPIELEDTQINQYFLDKNKEIFEKRMEEYQIETQNYELSMRKALRDTIGITNALFESYFKLNDEEEMDEIVFNRMVKEDLDKLLIEGKNKARVARIIREIKEIDYNNSVRLEKRMLRDIDEIEKAIIRDLKRSTMDKVKKLALEERIRHERKNLDANQRILSEYLEYVSTQRQDLALEHKEVIEKIKLEEQKVRLQEKNLIALEKKKALQIYQAEMKKIAEKKQKEKKKLQDQIKLQKQEEKKKLITEQKRIKMSSLQRIEKEKQKIQEDLNKKIKKLEETNT